MALAEQPLTEKSFLDRPVLANLTVNWEIVLYFAIFIVAIVTRFYDLGARVMSHDESLHALFSFKLYDGDGYIHDPLMHGPLQFHLVALSYLLFGDNDFSARIPSAICGVLLVILPFWFRPWLGKIGALVTSVGLLISPSLLYYGRYIRNEALITLFTAMLAMSLFQYMRTRERRWLYWGSAAVALSLASKEVALIHGFIGVIFIGGAFLWEWIPQKNFRVTQLAGLAVSILLLIVGVVRLNLTTPEGGTSESSGMLLMIAGLLLSVVLISIHADRQKKPTSKVLQFIPESAMGPLIGSIILAVAIFVVFHTTFFSNPPGIVSGTWGAVTYWLAQQEVQRGSQPGYYYIILMVLYEFLPLLIGGIGAIYYLIKAAPSHVDQWDSDQKSLDNPENEATEIHPSDGGTFVSYLIVWAIGSFVIYSWAGEKMPWLNTHITLPFIFLMGHVSQTIYAKFEWTIIKERSGLLFTLLLPLWLAALIASLSLRPFEGQQLDQLRETSQFMAAIVAFVAISYGLWHFGVRLQWKQVNTLIFTVVFAIMTILTVRFAWLSTFVNYDYVNEFLVYAHGAPDVKWVLEEIDDISRRTVGDKQIKIAYGGVIWPLEWYMREYPNRAFFGSSPNRDALDAPVVLVSPDPDVKLEDVEPYLGNDYHKFTYRQVWWPVEDYKNQTFSRLWNSYVSPQTNADGIPAANVSRNWSYLWNIFFYRENIDHSFNEWPFRTQMYYFVRRDVLNELWNYRTGPLTATDIPIDPYEGVIQTLPASQIWGSVGEAEGSFTFPRAIDVSQDGLVYVADSGNHRIQVFDENGVFLKSWGGTEGVGPGELTEPWGIAVADDGRVYVSDTWNHRIQIFDDDGNYLSEFGQFANTDGTVDSAAGSFWGPRDIVVAADGSVFVSDTGNKRVQKFSADGEFQGAWGGGGVIPGHFEEPVGLAIDDDGNIYVADTWNHRIQKFDANFEFIAEWPVVGWESENVVNKPFITVDSQDRVYISDPENYRIIVYSAGGELLTTFGYFGTEAEAFRLPLGVATGPDDTLFVLDSDNNRVMKFTLPE
ncbi:MAG: flippase activity-associated protein Agl23 [Chloroflexota bacterium]